MTTSAPSQVRQSYHRDSEAAVKGYIKWEFHASYVYLLMSYYFDQDDVVLKNFGQYFLHQSQEVKLQNQVGSPIFLQDIKKLHRGHWESGLKALECALHLEKNVSQLLLELHKLTTDKIDPHSCFFIETHYLDEQVKSIRQLADPITNLGKMGAPHSGMEECLFDKHTLGDSDNES
ncbi:ferritin heavy chain-like [Notamacropus eugenii]|uniref:ferritin heavy chain-like n=1 Tax=Notamacropus eugenii TaxID=9315 RepID=UPI003B68246E